MATQSAMEKMSVRPEELLASWLADEFICVVVSWLADELLLVDVFIIVNEWTKINANGDYLFEV